MEEKISQIISECYDKLNDVFEENGKHLDYSVRDYMEYVINQEYERV